MKYGKIRPGTDCRQRFFFVTAVLILSGCSDPPLAGNLSAREICDASETLVLQRLGEGFSGSETECNVQPVDERYVQVFSSYADTTGTSYNYAARAVVNEDTLRIYEIRVEGMDDFFLPYRFFPNREF